MSGFGLPFTFFFVAFTITTVYCAAVEEKAKSVDLEDYIDTGKNDKKSDLGTAETGYYGHYDHGHYGHHYPVYHHHGYHHHGYHHEPYVHGHAHTYFTGEYGGHGHHVGSAHVSYGTDIHHGHPHHHHYH